MAAPQPKGANGADSSEWESVWSTPAWLIVFFSNLFCGCAGFAIVIPTLWPFLREMNGTTDTLAWAIALYSVGEGLGAVMVGRLYERYPAHPKTLLMGGLVIGFFSALTYSIAPIFGDTAGQYVVMATRLFQGIDNGGRQTIEQSFLSSAVPPKKLATVSARLGSFAITGIMVGPALGGPLLALDIPVPGMKLRIDGNNAPGLLLCATCIINLTVTYKYFHPEVLEKQMAENNRLKPKGPSSDDVCTAKPPNSVGIGVCYCIFTAMYTTIASQAFLPVVAQEVFGWGPCLDPSVCQFRVQQTYVNGLVSVGAIMSLAMALWLSFQLGEKISGREPAAIAVALAIITCVNLACVDWGGSLSPWRFGLAYLVGMFFGGFFRAPGYSLFAKIIGPHPKARYMGTSFFVGAMPRVFGPFIFVRLLSAPSSLRDAHFQWVYDGPMPRTWALYGSIAALNAIVLVIVLVCRRQCEPHPAIGEGTKEPLLKDTDGDAVVSESSAYLPATPSAVQPGTEGANEVVKSMSGYLEKRKSNRSIEPLV